MGKKKPEAGVSFGTQQDKDIYRHSASHVMAQAIKRLFPEAKLAIGPPIQDGFYYDIDLATSITPEMLSNIEKEMEKIVKEDQPFLREEIGKDEAIKMFSKSGDTYKVELLHDIPDKTVSIYRNGEFVDLCRGPHLKSTGQLSAFKLLSVAGAYWRGDEKNKMLQRIYGTAFPTKEELKKHLEFLEEAKRRDHRRLGQELDLFSIHDEIGRGLIHWHPKGEIIKSHIINYWTEKHIDNDYQIVSTPHIASERIYQISGHLQNYADLMYAPMEIEGSPYRVKPMNCPGHMMIYKTALRSYRELPMRIAEMGTVYRFEKGGVLHGLLRVRGFTIDDAHIICAPEQLESEIMGAFNLAMEILKTFGFNEYSVQLATMPEKHVGTPERWAQATETLRKTLESNHLDFTVDEGGGAFYGPKIDVKVKDCLGRLWQCTTVQFDFNLPERFNITYVGQDGQHHQPYIVHRALLGSLERFTGLLIEQFAGAFPLWLSPVQVDVIPVSVENAEIMDYCRKLKDILWKEHRVRVKLEDTTDTLSYKIRQSQKEKIPYTLVIGEKEVENNSVSVRQFKQGDKGQVPLAKFIQDILEEIKTRAIR